MRASVQRLTVLCSAALLLACAGAGRQATAPLPVFAGADQAYLAGRHAHLAQQLDQAILAYRAALQAMPGHVNARNGLAASYAERGQLAEAIALWQAVLAESPRQTGPENSFLYSNLGYAYLLQGQTSAAMAALEQACVLDPLNHRAWRHMGSTLEKLGQHARARQMFQQSRALLVHDFKTDYAVAERNGVSAIDQAVQAAQPQGQEFDQSEVRQNEAGVFELRRIVVPKLARAPAPVAPLQSAMVEIRNGNGVSGMAKSLASDMPDDSLRVVPLSNQKGYGVRQTRVEYQPRYRAAAERLAERFGADVVAVERVGRANVRLVIGRDLIRPGAGALPLASRYKVVPKAG